MAPPRRPTAADLRRELRRYANGVRAAAVARFFKTAPGGYGEGDVFIGVTVPDQRIVARQFRDLPLPEVDVLLQSRVHEERLTALLILVAQFNSGDERCRRQIFRLYLQRLRCINNWDLVDTSAPQIVGGWLADKPRERTMLLTRLAGSPHLWSRRVAMLATFHAIVNDADHRDAIRVATILVRDEHDLIQKAVGWMLREVGKRASADALDQFLARHAATMPRTALRYAIERLPEAKRKRWMAKPRRPATQRGGVMSQLRAAGAPSRQPRRS